MGHIHQLRHRHVGKGRAVEGPEADMLAARQLGAPVSASATTNGDDSSGTVVSVVYVTAPTTFTGSVAGYSTLDVGEPVTQAATTTKDQESSTPSSTDDASATTSAEKSSSALESQTSDTSTTSPAMSSSALSTMTSAMVTTSATSVLTSVSQRTSSPTIGGGAFGETTASSTAKASPSNAQTGMSAGGKAGLAIGVLLAIAIVAAGVLFLYWKRKKAFGEEEKSHNEKAAFGTDAAPIAGSNFSSTPQTTPEKIGTSAPTLDLRPMSRLMPDLMGVRRSQGNALNTFNAPTAAAAAGASRSLTPPQGGSPWERPPNTTNEKVENPFSDPTNPFGDEQAKAVSPSPSGPDGPDALAAPEAPAAPATLATPDAPALDPSMPAPLNIRSAAPVAAAGAAVAAAAVAASSVAAAKAPGSPIRTHSANLSQGAAGAVAGPRAPPSNVHRVQLDFKPSMDDELELYTGQPVRILHEYDDGWALCIRLDRSQQGVAPRTCLSPNPLKPRPMNNGPPRPGPRDARRPPPLGPNGRPMTPNGGPPRPMSPARGPGPRPMTPNGGPGPRPMSPARGPGARPMTPTGGPSHRFNGPPPMSPIGGSRMRASSSATQFSRPTSPSSAPYNQTPRPLSPGPIAGSSRALRPEQQRSMSPGPCGGGAGPGKIVAANQRRRSSSASALDVRERRNTPPGPSPLGSGAPPPPGWELPPSRPIGSDAVAPES